VEAREGERQGEVSGERSTQRWRLRRLGGSGWLRCKDLGGPFRVSRSS